MVVYLLHPCLWLGWGFTSGICIVYSSYNSQSLMDQIPSLLKHVTALMVYAAATIVAPQFCQLSLSNNVNLHFSVTENTAWIDKEKQAISCGIYYTGPFTSPQPLDSPHHPPPRHRQPASLCSPRRPSRAASALNAWSRVPAPAVSPHLQTQDSVSAFPLLNPRSLPRALCHRTRTLPHNKWVTLQKILLMLNLLKRNAIYI